MATKLNALDAIDQHVLRRSWVVSVILMMFDAGQLARMWALPADTVAAVNLTGAGIMAVMIGGHLATSASWSSQGSSRA